MDKILIVSSTEQGADKLTELISRESFSEKDIAVSAAGARRLVSLKTYDTILINTPLHDEFGDKLACELSEKTDAGLMMLVKSELEAETEGKVCSYGVFVIAKPVNKQLFYKALRLLEAASDRMKGIRHEKSELLRKIDDDRTINRAKSVLIKYLSMSEPQAHKYLEKQAMDLRITKAEVAKRLLSTYDN